MLFGTRLESSEYLGPEQVNDWEGRYDAVRKAFTRWSLFGKRIESLLRGTGPCAISG